MRHSSRRLIVARLTVDSVVFLLACLYLGPDDDVTLGLELLDAHTAGTDEIIVVGDLNCRIGRGENPLLSDELPHGRLFPRRSSLDTTTNRRGRVLLNYVDREGLVILNGRTLGDQQGSFTFTSPLGRSVIDLCFVSTPILPLVQDFVVCPLATSSDHLPVRVDLTFSHSPTKTTPTQRIKWNASRSVEFNARLRELLFLTPLNSGAPDATAVDLHSAMTLVADELGMIKAIHPTKHPAWFNGECRRLRAQLGQLTSECTSSGFSNHLVEAMNESRRQYREACKEAEALHNGSLLTRISDARSPAELWSAIKSTNKFLYSQTDQSINLHIPSVLSHFDALFNKFPDNELTLPTNTHVSFLDPFTPAELDRTLASLQKNKAPGNDGLSNEFFVAFDLQNRLWLLKFFNNILTTESCPQSWSDYGAIMERRYSLPY